MQLYSTFLLVAILCTIHTCVYSYLIGTGKADITGPVAEIHLFGYAEMDQIANGILQRCYARAYIVVDDASMPDESNSDHSTGNRIVFVNVDLQSMSLTVKARVVQRLQLMFGPDMYSMQNVMISSTHTHSNTGGYLEHCKWNRLKWGGKKIPLSGFENDFYLIRLSFRCLHFLFL
jgi:neutral ceramidase